MRLVTKATECGATRRSLSRFEWDCAGNCHFPHLTEMQSRPSGRETWSEAVARPAHPHEFNMFGRWTSRTQLKRVVLGATSLAGITLQLDLWTRCRKCDRCRAQRAALWRMRAIAETSRAPRTWFGTLTLKPEEQLLSRLRAQARLAAEGVDWDTLGQGEQFSAHQSEVSGELTKYLKRLRKQTSSPFRYLLVAEQHKSGDPHYHVLIHEVDPDQPIRHAQISGQWKLGFSRFKLIDNANMAGYVCKYLSKSAKARVRASQRYGDTTVYDHSDKTLAREEMTTQNKVFAAVWEGNRTAISKARPQPQTLRLDTNEKGCSPASRDAELTNEGSVFMVTDHGIRLASSIPQRGDQAFNGSTGQVPDTEAIRSPIPSPDRPH